MKNRKHKTGAENRKPRFSKSQSFLNRYKYGGNKGNMRNRCAEVRNRTEDGGWWGGWLDGGQTDVKDKIKIKKKAHHTRNTNNNIENDLSDCPLVFMKGTDDVLYTSIPLDWM